MAESTTQAELAAALDEIVAVIDQALGRTAAAPVSAVQVAQMFHTHYERLAPQFNYQTRPASAVPWDSVPENNRRLMVTVAGRVLEDLGIPVAGRVRGGLRG